MVTGFRRGELCALRWLHVDLVAGVLMLERSIGQRSGRTWEKDTKTHQHRRVALDQETVTLLSEHRRRCEARAETLGVQLADAAFVFSPAVDGSEHLKPDSVSQRYARLATRLGISTTIHKLRHYSTTELISAGVDVRTVAGRLGHGGGGTTTLKVYAAWVFESDQRAATSLFARLPARPEGVLDQAPPRGDATYERIAAELRAQIASGELSIGAPLPTHKQLAEQYEISVSTAHRVTALLASESLIEISRGRRATVIHQPSSTAAEQLPEIAEGVLPPRSSDTVLLDSRKERASQLLDLEIRRRGRLVKKLTTQADPTDPHELRQLLVDAIRRDGQDESHIAEYEMDIRHFGEPSVLTTFVATVR